MKHTILLFFVLTLGCFCKAGDLLIPLKGSLALPFSKKVHVADSSILKVRVFDNALLATGSKLGTTTVWLNSQKRIAHVVEPRTITAYEKMKKMIEGKLGLSLGICDALACVQGELLTYLDYQSLVALAKEFRLKWRLHAQIPKRIQEKISQALRADLQNNNLPALDISFEPHFSIKVSSQNKNLIHELHVFSDYRGIQVIEDQEALSLKPIIDLKVEIVEFKKSSFLKIGMEYPGTYRASILPRAKPEILPFEIALHNLEQKGEAHILASPRLSCRSGEEAQFLAGGEFPIRIMNYKTNDIQWKKHGILLKFKPLADLNGKIRLSLTTEVSLLDSSQTVDGVPGLLVNRVESHVDLLKKQTLLISGLVKKIKGESKEGFALLSHIPIIGALFGSQDYRNDQTDLVIFITPDIL